MKHLLLSFVLLIPIVSFAQTTVYPESDWETAMPESQGVNPAALKQLEDYVFTETPSLRSDALVVIRGGKIIFERYASGYNRDMRHISWSMAKSVTSLLAGIAESEGFLSRTTKMTEFYPYPASSEEEQKLRDQVTVYSLLTMSSGIQWKEDYSAKAPLQSDVTQMLYMNPRNDFGAYVASRPMEAAPYDHFYYSTGNTMLVMAMLRQKMSEADYDRYPWTRLFDRIGMKRVTFEQDQAGTFAGGSYVYATARDYARLGYLLLNEGRWKDTQVIPAEWMKVIRTLSPGQASGTIKPSDEATYGAGFWLNIPARKWNLPAPYPAAPGDLYMALGHNGQSIAVIPSLGIVAVRLAHDTDKGLNLNTYLGLLSRSVQGSTGATSDDGRATTTKPLLPRAVPNFTEEDELAPIPVKHTSMIYFTKLLASVRAKDFCSCRFVEGQSIEFCRERVKNGFPIFRMHINESAESASFGLLPSQRASLVSEELGCQFDSR